MSANEEVRAYERLYRTGRREGWVRVGRWGWAVMTAYLRWLRARVAEEESDGQS